MTQSMEVSDAAGTLTLAGGLEELAAAWYPTSQAPTSTAENTTSAANSLTRVVGPVGTVAVGPAEGYIGRFDADSAPEDNAPDQAMVSALKALGGSALGPGFDTQPRPMW